ncbi:8-oxoguanine glycosylase ogg1 [Sorochytrium milnesiophthora]
MSAGGYATAASVKWRALGVTPQQLRLDVTLRSGQSFTWKQTGEQTWSNVIRGMAVSLRQTESDCLYCRLDSDSDDRDEETRALLHDYFQLHVDLPALYTSWSSADRNFAVKAPHIQGVRMMRQEYLTRAHASPKECLFAFICSSNNNIQRISGMVDKLKTLYGRQVAVAHDGTALYSFCSISSLAGANVEPTLRASGKSSAFLSPWAAPTPLLTWRSGFGYRAKYIAQTAAQLSVLPDAVGWLHSLREASYDDAKTALLKFPGIGPKVADCILLMSLDKPGAIPVDTHVWQIAVRDYGFSGGAGSKRARGGGSSLTAANYSDVGRLFRDAFGEYAGWAHSVLFTSDLRAFADRVGVVVATDETTKVMVVEKEEEKRGDRQVSDDDATTSTQKRRLRPRRLL